MKWFKPTITAYQDIVGENGYTIPAHVVCPLTYREGLRLRDLAIHPKPPSSTYMIHFKTYAGS